MSVNKVIMIGRLGKDPDVRYLDNGVAVATFSMATTERAYTAKNGQQVPERTEWHNVVLWRGLAETAEKYLKKGDLLYVEGKLRSRSYEDQQGVKRTVVEIFADNMEMLTPKGNGSGKPLPQEIPPPATGDYQSSASGYQNDAVNVGSTAQPAPSYANMPQGGQIDLSPTSSEGLPF